MTTGTKQDQAAMIQPPRCPHCSKQLPTVGLFNWSSPPWLIMSVSCAHCEKILHLQVVPVGVEDPSRIARPH